MKKENGFTLIELLAVIVILAIIAVIATPLTINVINEAKEKSFINTVYGLIDGARLLSAEQELGDGSKEVIINFTDGTADNINFKVSGEVPNGGTVHLNSDGKIELKVWSEELGKCAEKSTTESEVKFTETSKEDCKIEINVSTAKTFKEVMEPLVGTEVMNNDPDSNLRYVGQSPNNYVSFNGELWRIIGVFNGQAKIIRNDYFSLDNEVYMSWGNSSNWKTSYLNSLLNDPNTGYIEAIRANDSDSYGYIDLIHVWNTGGVPFGSDNYSRVNMYNFERGTSPAGASGSEATWIGAIGLMYASDYGYSASGTAETCDNVVMSKWSVFDGPIAFSECVEKSWLYDENYNQWTLTPESDDDVCVFRVTVDGYVDIYSGYYNHNVVRPTLYLKSDTKIVDGQGTYDEPFELGV